MIRALEDNNVDWIVFRDSTVDGRDDLRFPDTHPMVWEYMTSNFAEFPLEGLPKRYRILRRTADTGSAR